MATIEEVDSGMESQNSKADTPEKRTDMDDFDDEDDETLGERLWGLTEMFPEPVRRVTGAVSSAISKTIKVSYGFSRQAAWIVATSSLILFAPVMFEVERANAQEAMRRDQQHVLLGPNAGAPPPR